jgi:hypothetical protein
VNVGAPLADKLLCTLPVFDCEGAQWATGDTIMGNALVWMLGISASVIALAYLMILAAIVAAKRRMASPLSRNSHRVGDMARMSAMHYYRTP